METKVTSNPHECITEPAPSIAPQALRKERIYYLDACRALAICAVVLLHVVSKYLYLYKKIPPLHWQITNVIDSVVRWGVPVFIMISGALLIRPINEFNASYYIKRRLLKVMIPFLAWSVIYAAWAANGGDFFSFQHFNMETLLKAVWNIPTRRTYMHLAFFYYFIPLYFVIPLLSLVVSRTSRDFVLFYLCGWLFLCLLKLLNAGTDLTGDTLIFSGFLMAGYYIHHYNLLGRGAAWIFLLASLLVTIVGTALATRARGDFSQLFYSYKSLNVAVAALCIIQLAKHYCNAPNRVFAFVSRHSMGIYLIHILFMKAFEFNIPVFRGMNPVLVVPICAAFTFSASLAAAWILSKIPLIKHITP